MLAVSRPRSSVFGSAPTAMSQWDAWMVSPLASVTTTPSPSRRTATARERARTSTPRRLKTSCSTLVSSRDMVLPGQDHVPARDEGDLGAERVVRAGELGACDARPHDDKVLRDLLERVHLLPVEDPLPVGLRIGKLSRTRARGEQDHLGVEALLAPLDGRDDRVRSL